MLEDSETFKKLHLQGKKLNGVFTLKQESPPFWKFERSRLPLEKQIPIIKLDDEKQIAYGVVLEPDTVDAQGDRITKEEIEKACYWFMEHSQKFREMHKGGKIDARVVENYLAPQDLTFNINGKTEKVREGSWIMGVKVYDPETWHKCKSGEYTGFSIGGYGLRQEVTP